MPPRDGRLLRGYPRGTLGSGRPYSIDARFTEAFVRMQIVLGEVEVVLDERNADVRVVSDAVAMDDGIDQQKRAQEKDEQNSFVATRTIHRGSRERWSGRFIEEHGRRLRHFLRSSPPRRERIPTGLTVQACLLLDVRGVVFVAAVLWTLLWPNCSQAVVGNERPRLSRVRGVRNHVIAFIRVLICCLQDTPRSLLPQLGSCIRPTSRGLN